MAYVRIKVIKGHKYQYLVKSVRKGDTVRQVHIRYIGPEDDRPKSWHTKRERELITSFGGEPKVQKGTDGVYRGKPVEVRCARKDRRFRIQKDTHEELMRDGGFYIFDAPKKDPVMVPASAVDGMMSDGEWYKDRSYPHKFVTVDQVYSQ